MEQTTGYQLAYAHYWKTVIAGFGQKKAAHEYAQRHAQAFEPKTAATDILDCHGALWHDASCRHQA